MREMIVPKSFDVHRTKANALPGAKLTTRVRRLKTRSSAIQPKRIQCSIRFSSQVSSTRVSAAKRSAVGDPPAEGRRSMCVSFAVGEFAAEQVAQHAGDGHHSRRSAGLFDFSHCRLIPLEYRLPARFETIPSKPS